MSIRKRYSLQELQAVNSEKLIEIDYDLELFLAKIHRNKFLHGYLNPYNKYLCPPGQRKKLFPKAQAFSDDKLVEDTKAILSKVTNKNKTQIIDKVSRLPFTQTCWPNLIQMIHEVTINCIFFVEPLLEVILEIAQQHEPLIKELCRLCLEQFETPREFSSSLIELEDPMVRKKRWQIDNIKLIAHLYVRDLWNQDQFESQILTKIIEQIKPENSLGIDIMCAIWSLIKNKLAPDRIEFYKNRLTVICEDKNYPTRQRFILMDLLET